MLTLFAMIPAIFSINPLIFLNRDHLDDYPGIHPFIIHQRAAFHIPEINMYAYCLLPKPSTICHMSFCLFGNYNYRDLMLKCKKKTNNANCKPVPSRDFGSLGTGRGMDNPITKVWEWEGNGKKQFPKFGKGKKTISKIREWEENENNLFPKFGNGKGLKKSIPNSIQRQSFPGIAGNGNSNGK